VCLDIKDGVWHTQEAGRYAHPIMSPRLSYAQNLNFGMMNMTTNNTAHPIPTQAHSVSLAKKPLPSVIFRNIPIRRSADSIPPTFLSNAEVALSTSGFEASSAVEKDCVDLFKARARSRREVVRSSCVRVCGVRRVSVVEAAEEAGRAGNDVVVDDVVVAVEVVVAASVPGRRDRNADVKCAAAACVWASFVACGVSSCSVSMPEDTSALAGANLRRMSCISSPSSSASEESGSACFLCIDAS